MLKRWLASTPKSRRAGSRIAARLAKMEVLMPSRAMEPAGLDSKGGAAVPAP